MGRLEDVVGKRQASLIVIVMMLPKQTILTLVLLKCRYLSGFAGEILVKVQMPVWLTPVYLILLQR